MEQLVNSIIKRDVQEITKWNWLGMSESIKSALEVNWFQDFISQPAYEALGIVADNFARVYNKYFIWKEDSGKPPISVYTDIFGKWPDILEELTEGLATDVFENALSYEIRLVIELRLQEFPETLLQVGYVHKFDRDHALEFFFPEDEED